MPSILFFNRVFPPVRGMTGELLAELAEKLSRANWDVSVVTCCSPTENFSKAYPNISFKYVQGIPFTKKSHFKRGISYLSLYPGLLWHVLTMRRHDIIVSMTDPPLCVLLSPIMKLFKRGQLVHWAQDMYPEVAEELDVIPRKGLVANLLRKLSTWALQRQDKIIVIGRCMKERLIGRGIPAEKIIVIPNWAQSPKDANQEVRAASLVDKPSSSRSRDVSFRTEHKLEGRFLVMYSGSFGLVHQFEAIAQSARLLEAQNPAVLFIFMGDGPRLAALKEQTVNLTNVRFLPFQPKHKLEECLQAADLHLAVLRDNLCGLVVPSKIYGMVAAGRPCIFLGPRQSEAARLILENNCGSVLEKATGEELAEIIQLYIAQPELLNTFALAAGQIADGLTLKAATGRFITVINGITSKPA